MTQSVRVPDPVYDRITRAAESMDVSRGVVVKEWMEKAEKYDKLEDHRR